MELCVWLKSHTFLLAFFHFSFFSGGIKISGRQKDRDECYALLPGTFVVVCGWEIREANYEFSDVDFDESLKYFDCFCVLRKPSLPENLTMALNYDMVKVEMISSG